MPFYTSASKVQGYLQVPTAFSGSTSPTLAQVENLIRRVEAQIEQRTGHAWRTQREFREFPEIRPRRYWRLGAPVYLGHRLVKDLDSNLGDTFEVWNGSSYDDWLATKNEGRGNDFWIENRSGVLFIQTIHPRIKSIRISYRYGGIDTAINDVGNISDSVTTVTVDSTAFFPQQGVIRIESEEMSYTGLTSTTITGMVRGINGTTAAAHNDDVAIFLINQEIEDLATKMVVVDLLKSDDRSVILSESGVNFSLPEKTTALEREISQIITNHKEFKLPSTEIADGAAWSRW